MSLTGNPLGFLALREHLDLLRDRGVQIADGSAVIRITHHPATDWEPCWSPDGARIAFTSNRDGNYEIYVMNADGSDPVNLTQSPATDWQPAWSPDGAQIAFISDREGKSDVYVMEADGSDSTRIAVDFAVPTGVAWSPEGDFLVFSANAEGSYELFAMGARLGPQPLTNTAAENSSPSWSPRTVTSYLADPGLVAVEVDSTPVYFPDPALKAAVREMLGKPADVPLIVEDARRWNDITNEHPLVASGRGIKDRRGLEAFKDVSPLANLARLTILGLARNQIEDISPLLGLSNLTYLSLGQNPLDEASRNRHIQTFLDRGVDVRF